MNYVSSIVRCDPNLLEIFGISCEFYVDILISFLIVCNYILVTSINLLIDIFY